MPHRAPQERPRKSPLIQVMGAVLFVAGILSSYANFPVDHPWWFDLGGIVLSGVMVTTPHLLGEIAKSILKRP